MFNPLSWSLRMQYLYAAIFCFGVIAYAIFLQFSQNLQPCSLCIFQRVAFFALGISFLLGAIHNPSRAIIRKVYGVFVALVACVGMGIAGRHVWIQLQPPSFGGCNADASFLVEAFGMIGMIKKVLTATGNCGDIDWTFLGLSMPGWSLVCFVVLLGWALFAGFKSRLN